MEIETKSKGMTVKELIEMTGVLPNWFEVAGNRYEIETGVSKGGCFAIIWRMNLGQRGSAYCIQYGDTTEEARENLKKYILTQ